MNNQIIQSGFEGPEKRLEVTFKKQALASHLVDIDQSLRVIPKEQWQDMLDLAACTIISQMGNEEFDAYVLSESSLFVYPQRIMIKTCGTTTLLKILPKLLEYADLCGLEVELVMFSRKNFVFPHRQVWPHNKWDHELEVLTNTFGDKGKHHIMGPLTEDHWYVYVVDMSSEDQPVKSEVTVELMMHHLDPEIMNQFFKKPEVGERDKFPGIAELIPGQDTDEFNFTPCGYSMNGMLREAYSTIHITPELHCSYVSYETNFKSDDYRGFVESIVNFFRPGSITLAFYTKGLSDSAFSDVWDSLSVELPGFQLPHKAEVHSEGPLRFTMCNLKCNDLLQHVRNSRRLSAGVATGTSHCAAQLADQVINSDLNPMSLQTEERII